MSTLFEDRERAAEYGYTHAEELRFLALREGIEVVAAWAAETLGESEAAGTGYASALVGRLVGGAGEADIAAQVRKDLEAGGQPDRGREAASRLAQAVAVASDRLAGRLPPHHEPAVRASHPASPHPHGFWGWTV